METIMQNKNDIFSFLQDFSFQENQNLLSISTTNCKTKIDYITIENQAYPKFINEFWTSKQRQASSLHEISYRACFKPQVPRFFIELFTREKDIVYDPFAGRGTTMIEAGLHGRNIISNDINPLSKILTLPRFFVPDLKILEKKLNEIPLKNGAKADRDLSMFFHPDTEAEIVSLKDYLLERKENKKEDYLDMWIRMIATNRLTGHSKGFFSVYTLPPNQAVSPESQIKINAKRNQKPEYRNTKQIILKKSNIMTSEITQKQIESLKTIGKKGIFLISDARNTDEIPEESVQLTVTSPPFLDVVQYSQDNWLRCWFNSINADEIGKKITMSKTIEHWNDVMGGVFKQLFRITKNGGWVAFEVGDVKNKRIMLDEYVVPLGLRAGFKCHGIVINEQEFTKTANIWGIKNNDKGTNTNRIVLFKKEL